MTSPLIALPVTLLIRADELCAGQHMVFHGLLDFGFGRFPKIKRDIQGVELMEVAVPTDRRTGAAIRRLCEIIQPKRDAFRQPRLASVFGHALGIGRYIVDDPMHPHPLRRFWIRGVGIVDDEDEALRPLGHPLPSKRRRDIVAFASVLRGDLAILFEGGRSQGHGHSSGSRQT